MFHESRMSTNRQLAHNTIIQFGGKIISTILGMFALGLMARYLGTEQFGWYTSAIAFLQFIGIITDFGMTPVTAQMLSESDHDNDYLFRNLMWFRIVTTIIAFGAAPMIALALPYPPQVDAAIALTSISFIAIAVNQVLLGYNQTKLQMHIQAFGELLGRVVLVVSLWLLITRGESFLWFMGAVTLASVVFTATTLWFVRKQVSLRPAYDKKIWRSIVTKSWPIALSIICNVVYLKGDIVLMQWFVPQHDIGIYGAAYRVLDVITQSGMMLMGLLLPLLAFAWSRQDRALFTRHYQQAFDILMLFALPFTAGAIILATPVMTLIGGPEFAPSGPILAILSLAILGVYVGAVFGHLAVAINRQKETIWIYLTTAIITLIGYLVFIPRFGIYGAAWMSVFSEIYAGILLWWVIRRYVDHPLELRTTAKILVASIVMALITYALRALPVLLLIPISAIVYGMTIIGIGGISRATLREIISLRKQSEPVV